MNITRPLLALLTAATMHAEPFQYTLTSVGKNVRAETWEANGKAITPAAPGWSVRKSTLRGGKQEGVDVIVVNNGKLEFTVVPPR